MNERKEITEQYILDARNKFQNDNYSVEEIVKDIKKMAEESKVAVRNVRRDEMDIAKSKLKNKEISEDEEKAEEDRIQKETDKYVAKIEEICDKKEKEIMSV